MVIEHKERSFYKFLYYITDSLDILYNLSCIIYIFFFTYSTYKLSISASYIQFTDNLV